MPGQLPRCSGCASAVCDEPVVSCQGSEIPGCSGRLVANQLEAQGCQDKARCSPVCGRCTGPPPGTHSRARGAERTTLKSRLPFEGGASPCGSQAGAGLRGPTVGVLVTSENEPFTRPFPLTRHDPTTPARPRETTHLLCCLSSCVEPWPGPAPALQVSEGLRCPHTSPLLASPTLLLPPCPLCPRVPPPPEAPRPCPPVGSVW